MVAVLSSLTRLETLDLDINRSQSDWENRSLPLMSCTVLPSLTTLKVKDDIKSLEDFMARIDAPLLDRLHISIVLPYWDQVMLLNIPHLLRFISHIPKLQALDEARIGFDTCSSKTWIKFDFSTQLSHRVVLLEFLTGIPHQ